MSNEVCVFCVIWMKCVDTSCGDDELGRKKSIVLLSIFLSRHYTGLFNSIKVISLSLELGPLTVLRVIDLLWLSVCVLMQASRYSSILSHMNAMYVYRAHFSLQRNNNILCKLLQLVGSTQHWCVCNTGNRLFYCMRSSHYVVMLQNT